MALISSDLSFFITDRRYAEQAKDQIQNAEILIAKKDLIGEIKNAKLVKPGTKLCFEAAHLAVKDYAQLRKAYPDAKLLASERIIERIASVKDRHEIENVRKAAAICGEVYDEILALLSPGVTELEISAELSYRCRRRGSERDPFEPIVASGKRSALPHGVSSVKKLRKRDLVVIDFGAVVNGYAADFTRTVVLGKPTAKQAEMAEVVQTTLEVSEKAAKPGLSGKELDGIARDYFKERGYGEYFQHSLGHGLGLEVHGLPRIGEQSDDQLEVGNVVTLEPGVYVPEVGGVRIEDDFVITKNGVENLTPFPRQLASAR